jgi:circadian clock protein KaiC
VIASLQENTTQLERIGHGFGWSLGEPRVEVLYRSPVDIYIDEWVYELMAAVERTGARRVVIDSLTDLRMAAPDETRFREFIYSLTQRFSLEGVSTLMTMEIPDLFHLGRLSESALSHLSDNVVLLSYVREDHSIHRALSVIKSRASDHHPDIRPFLISRDGIVLADRPHPPDGSPADET